MSSSNSTIPLCVVGRYAVFDEIAAGGMATVHLGRLVGPVGFSRTVAVKRLHAHLAKDPDFSAGFVDEARLAARIHHPNVVSIVDVIAQDGELSLVMDYVEGDSLATLLRNTISLGLGVPLPIASAIICGALYGLHAAHEAKSETGEPLCIVHRDVSPQNILVGTDGVPRIVDFGVAKAAQRLQTTADGQVKGKVAYMSPEQVSRAEVSRQTDIYAVGVVFWEMIAGCRLFQSDNQAHLLTQVLAGNIPPPSRHRPDCPPELDALVQKALSNDPKDRFQTAREMAVAVQQCLAPAPPTDVGDWVTELAPDGLTERRHVRSRVESGGLVDPLELAEAQRTGIVGTGRSSPHDATRPVAVGGSREEVTARAVTGQTTTVRSRRRGWPMAVLAILLLGGSAAALYRWHSVAPAPGEARLHSAGEPKQEGEPRPPRAEPVETEKAPSSDASGSATEGERGEPTDESSPSEDTDEQPTGATPPRAPTPPRGARRASPQRTAPSPCPKYYIDDEGIQRINRKCW